VWSWSDDDKAKEQHVLEEPDVLSIEAPPSTPPSSRPTTPSPAHRDSTPSMGDSRKSSTNQSAIKMRSLKEIYEQAEDGETNLFCLYPDHEPLTFQEAEEENCWRSAMEEEIRAIQKNDTWELTTLSQNQKVVGVKWVYKIKHTTEGEISQYMARLVAKGYKQKYSIDYEEVFAPVARLDTVRLLITLAAHHNWKIYQLELKSAFLNGILEEEIYVQQSEGFIMEGEESKVYHLKKALYGLK
jgi:hypothetical protein